MPKKKQTAMDNSAPKRMRKAITPGSKRNAIVCFGYGSG